MASPAYKINERRSSRGYVGGGRMFDASQQTSRRRRIPRLDSDARGMLSQFGWSELLSGSRYIFANFGPVRGAILQMANYAVGCGFDVIYEGRNEAWGEQMKEAIEQHDKICDVRGDPFDFESTLTMDLVSVIRDGDANFLLTETPEGYPMFQSIPAHRVRGKASDGGGIVEEGEWRGFAISHGVISNQYGRAVAFRLSDGDNYIDIPAQDFGQYYRPELCDQPRGIPWLASAINDIADIWDIRQFTKTGLKGVASRIMVEHNETGQPEPSVISGGPTATDDTSTPYIEQLEEGTISYVRAGSGGKIEIPADQRPSTNSQQFAFEILRGSFEALGWPIEFYDPTQLGGANIRLRVAQAMRTIEGLQEIAEKIATRKRLYAIAKLMKIGALPWDDDWWRIGHQTPRNITVDNGRDTKADLQALESGAMTFDEWYGQYGQDAKTEVRKSIQFRKWFEQECAANGVDPDRIIPPAQRSAAMTAAESQPAPAATP